MSVENKEDPTVATKGQAAKTDAERAAEITDKALQSRVTRRQREKARRRKDDAQVIFCYKCSKPGLIIEASRVRDGWVTDGCIPWNAWYSKLKKLDEPMPSHAVPCQECRQPLTCHNDGVGNLRCVGSHNDAIMSLKDLEERCKKGEAELDAYRAKREEAV